MYFHPTNFDRYHFLNVKQPRIQEKFRSSETEIDDLRAKKKRNQLNQCVIMKNKNKLEQQY
jgi:hypothetical protein